MPFSEIIVSPLPSWREERAYRPGRKCVMTCALSGVAANRDQCPAIPYTLEDYAAEAKRARESGASVVHLHARFPMALRAIGCTSTGRSLRQSSETFDIIVKVRGTQGPTIPQPFVVCSNVNGKGDIVLDSHSPPPNAASTLV